MSDTQEKLVMELVDEICDWDEYCGDENCNKCGGAIKHWKKKLTALIESAKREGAIEVRNLYGSPKCEALHHPKKYQHTAFEDCPVEKEIIALLEQSEESE